MLHFDISIKPLIMSRHKSGCCSGEQCIKHLCVCIDIPVNAFCFCLIWKRTVGQERRSIITLRIFIYVILV